MPKSKNRLHYTQQAMLNFLFQLKDSELQELFS
jgi:hypothetical protein